MEDGKGEKFLSVVAALGFTAISAVLVAGRG